MNQFIQGILLFAVLCSNVFAQNNRFRERYSWRTVDFQFPNDRTRQEVLNSQEYIPINNVIHGIEIWRDHFFVSIPRWKPGIASTLNYFPISRSNSNTSPTLIPWPNYETNRIRNNEVNFQNKIVSVVRMHADVCNRLWFVDMGVIDITGANRHVMTPRLFIYDLTTNRLIRTYTFTNESTTETMFGGSIAIDVSADNCQRAFAYIPDFQTYRLVVYSYEQNSAWRIRHPYFFFDPFATPFYVDGLLFLWVDGILGATLSAVQNDGYRTLYFAGLATNYQFSVSTRYLRDRNLALNTTTLLTAYRFLGTRGSNMQTTAHMMDQRTGIDFYALPNRNGVGCWNSNQFSNNYSPDTNVILATDDQTMIFPIDVITEDDDVWLLTDRLAVSLSRGLNPNDVNIRIFSANIREAVRGTVCDPDGNFDVENRFGSNSEIAEKKFPTLSEVLKADGSRYGSTNASATTSRSSRIVSKSGGSKLFVV